MKKEKKEKLDIMIWSIFMGVVLGITWAVGKQAIAIGFIGGLLYLGISSIHRKLDNF